MNKRDFYPTIEDYHKMGLSDYQINELINYENLKHYFRNQYESLYYFSKPHSIFFLDIKDTLYHSEGHDGSGVLGRSKDSLQISMTDILSLGRLLKDTIGQPLNMNLYRFSEEDNIKIDYSFPDNYKTAKYKNDIPTREKQDYGFGIKFNWSDNGPFKIVFISTDDVDTQKNIVLFLLVIETIWQSKLINFYYHKQINYIDSQEVAVLEKLFEKSNCDLSTFISNLPELYKSCFNSNTLKNIDKIMDKITFLSTKNSNLSKADLMKEYLDKYNIENKLKYDDYNIFACGDSYIEDGPMIKLAFLLGGYGCLNCYDFYYSNSEELLRKDLYEKYGIATKLPISSYSFTDFYNKVIDRLSLQRTWDIAETMQNINNNSKQKVLNRFKKTNHYIEIKKK